MADIHSSAWKGDLTAVEAALQGGAGINSLGLVDGKFGLLQVDGQFDIVQPNLNSEGRKVSPGVGRATPLHWACAANHIPLAKALLKKGACPQMTCEFGYSAKEVAEKNGFSELAEVLGRYEPKNCIFMSSNRKAHTIGDYCSEAKEHLASEHSTVTLVGLGEAISPVAAVAEILKAGGFATMERLGTSTVFVRARGSWSRPISKACFRVTLKKAEGFDAAMAKDKAEKEQAEKERQEKAKQPAGEAAEA